MARAGIYGDKGDREHAIEELTKVLELRSGVDARYRRGSAYQELGRHAEAIADFTWVIEQVRDAPYAYFARANSKRALGDQAGADQDVAAGQMFDRARR